MCVTVERQMNKTYMNQKYWLTATPNAFTQNYTNQRILWSNVVMISDVRVYCIVIIYLSVKYFSDSLQKKNEKKKQKVKTSLAIVIKQ